MQKKIILVLGLMFLFLSCSWVSAQQTIVAQKVLAGPTIDGIIDASVWDDAKAITTHDDVADIDMTIKAVYSDTRIYILVRFPDPDESRLHKPWVWDKEQQLYLMGRQREDTFVFKWALAAGVSDLSLSSDTPYEADIWFWKAHRTDPVGFADDKMQKLSHKKTRKSKQRSSKSGGVMYLSRLADEGDPAYRSILQADYIKDILPQFHPRQPSASRADVQAKGVWQDGMWTIEFMRLLKNTTTDDVQFDPQQQYYLGVSRFEMSGMAPDHNLSQPLYGSGDISEKLMLVFAK